MLSVALFGSPASAWHNGAVTNRKPVIAAVLALSCALVLSACGGEATKQEPSATPSTTVEVPEGVTLTPYGTSLQFGEAATVAYEPNKKRSSVLELTVRKVSRASISELGAYVLDEATRKSTPYYVDVTVKNVGDGDLGRIDVPLYLVDSKDTLIHSSSFTNTFKPCPSQPLPAKFAANASISTCLLFLAPAGSEYRQISYRPVQEVEPILWEGEATKSRALSKAESPSKPNKKKQKRAGN